MAPPSIAHNQLNEFGIDALCNAITSGNSLTKICQELGLSYGSMSTWITADADRTARVAEARRESAKLWDDMATETISSAEDPFSLAKAKEMAFHLRWRSSKIDPKGYGDRIQAEVTGKLTLEQLVAASRVKPETEGE